MGFKINDLKGKQWTVGHKIWLTIGESCLECEQSYNSEPFKRIDDKNIILSDLTNGYYFAVSLYTLNHSVTIS